MDSANPSSGIAAFFAVLLARLTGRRDAPEPADSVAGDLPENTWAHGESLDVPIPPAYLIDKMSEAEQAEFWKSWAIETDRAAHGEATGKAAETKR